MIGANSLYNPLSWSGYSSGVVNFCWGEWPDWVAIWSGTELNTEMKADPLTGARGGADYLSKAMTTAAQARQASSSATGGWLTQRKAMVSRQCLWLPSTYFSIFWNSSSFHFRIHHTPIFYACGSCRVPYLGPGSIMWFDSDQSMQQISWETVTGSGMCTCLGCLIRNKETCIQHFGLTCVGITLTTPSAP